MPTPRHKPTELGRKIVQALSGYGLKHQDIASHPDVSVSLPTLSKYYRAELKVGNSQALGKIGESLFNKAIGGDTASLIFLAKCRLGFKEVTRVENTGEDGKPIDMTITYRMVGDKAKP